MNTIKVFRQLILWVGILSLIQFAAAQDTVHVWYGSPDGAPVWGVAHTPAPIDVWICGTANTPIGGMHLCFGAQDAVIDSIYGCQILRPGFAEIQTTSPEHSPPNLSGWSSRSAILTVAGKAFVATNPIRLFSFYVKTVADPSLIGDTIYCIGAGTNSIYGHSSISDTSGGPGYVLVEHFSPLVIADMPAIVVPYTLGDMNGDQQTGGNDISFGVSYHHGQGLHPPDSLYHFMLPGDDYLYMAADANGDCRNSGADITYLVGYIKGKVLSLRFCPLVPPDPYDWPR